MTKVHTKTPREEFRIVKPDANHDHYEVWVIKPVCVGTLSRHGNANVVSDDKRRFLNIFYAAQHILMRAKESTMAQSMRLHDERPETRNLILTGMELLNLDKWREFRQLRGLTGPVSEQELKRQYSLAPNECAQLGLLGAQAST